MHELFKQTGSELPEIVTHPNNISMFKTKLNEV